MIAMFTKKMNTTSKLGVPSLTPVLMHYTIKKRKSQLENTPRATREALGYQATYPARTYPTSIPGPSVTAVSPALLVYFDIAGRSLGDRPRLRA
jgi:hypothetical protein